MNQEPQAIPFSRASRLVELVALLALIEGETDVVDRATIKLFLKQGTVVGLPFLGAASQRLIQRVRPQTGIRLAKPIGAITRPPIMRRVFHHRRAHRIELDVALAREPIGLGLNRQRLVAAVPQRTGAAVAAIDVLHVAPA